MKLVENVPLDTKIIEELIADKDDMFLVWPIAKFPFDHEQWREKLTKDKRNISLLLYKDNLLIGQGALIKTKNEDEYALSFLYIIPELRSQGYGEKMIELLEKYAKDNLNAKQLCLVVRTYNPRGLKCYLKCGFKEIGREDTLIKMNKRI
ncbi:GNAT family N-acetyltransferase [Wukongibacter baidiensis]|uniref:GNAT family N-acetyltransferase n=1 Tax=Wukongibacter baidiensis TaxID=1723361 RepID=UPI003D7F8711